MEHKSKRNDCHIMEHKSKKCNLCSPKMHNQVKMQRTFYTVQTVQFTDTTRAIFKCRKNANMSLKPFSSRPSCLDIFGKQKTAGFEQNPPGDATRRLQEMTNS